MRARERLYPKIKKKGKNGTEIRKDKGKNGKIKKKLKKIKKVEKVDAKQLDLNFVS